ncbi:MAG: GNAT family N-acetyltransferase [Bryobacteraceae bacterium]
MSSHNSVVWGVDAGLMTMIGRPDASLIRDALAACKQIVTLLAAGDQAEIGAGAVPEWEIAGARRLVHVENRAWRQPGFVRIAMLAPGDEDSTMSLPEGVRRDVAHALVGGAAAAAWVAGRVVSVCYTGWQTESFCDLAIFTTMEHRGRGYARAAAYHLIRHVRAAGKVACWFTDESNVASLNIARTLGFRFSDRVTVFRQPLNPGDGYTHGSKDQDSR